MCVLHFCLLVYGRGLSQGAHSGGTTLTQGIQHHSNFIVIVWSYSSYNGITLWHIGEQDRFNTALCNVIHSDVTRGQPLLERWWDFVSP